MRKKFKPCPYCKGRGKVEIREGFKSYYIKWFKDYIKNNVRAGSIVVIAGREREVVEVGNRGELVLKRISHHYHRREYVTYSIYDYYKKFNRIAKY